MKIHKCELCEARERICGLEAEVLGLRGMTPYTRVVAMNLKYSRLKRAVVDFLAADAGYEAGPDFYRAKDAVRKEVLAEEDDVEAKGR